DTSVTTMTCQLTNTHIGTGNTGYMILLSYMSYSQTESVTGTESFTCPAGATAQNSFGFPPPTFNLVLCYVQPTSTHATFSATVTVNTGTSRRVHNIAMAEVYGLGAPDTSAAANSNASSSVSVTTTANNEYIIAVGGGLHAVSNFQGANMTQLYEGSGGS